LAKKKKDENSSDDKNKLTLPVVAQFTLQTKAGLSRVDFLSFFNFVASMSHF